MKKSLSVLQIIMIFLGVLGLVVVMNTNKVFAQEDNVMYVSELQVGDYIPAGTVLLTEKTYVDIYSKKSTAALHLNWSKLIKLENNESTVLEDAATMLETGDNYEGWVVTEATDDCYRLSPANSDRSSKIVQSPTEENDYSVEYQCPLRYSGDIYNTANYTWYKYKSIAKPSIASTPAGTTGWTADNGRYEILDNKMNSSLEQAKLSFEFNAKKDNIVVFEMRGTKAPVVQINGVTQTISNISNIQYNPVKLRITESGIQKLDIIYYGARLERAASDAETYGHAVVRNFDLLTTINDGNQLDVTKVSSGDNICYECSCANGYLHKSTFRYVNGNEETPVPENFGSSEIVKNPATSNNAIYIVILIAIFGVLFMGIGIHYFRKNNSRN